MPPHKTILIIMISVKMMKSAAIRNLQEYGTTEHIFGFFYGSQKITQYLLTVIILGNNINREPIK